MMTHFVTWYKSICSQLQSPSQFEDIESSFNEQTSDKARVGILLQQPLITADIVESFVGKSNVKSEIYRKDGNKVFSNKNLNEALLLYSKSIAFAENGSELLSLAYANRSAVLFELDKFALCEKDIQLSFHNGYPLKLRYKLWQRLGKCFMKLNYFETSVDAFEKSMRELEESNLNTETKNMKVHTLLELIKECGSKKDTESNDAVCKNAIYEVHSPIISDGVRNKMFTCATESFGIVNKAGQGRHAVATRDIKAGETIIIEKAFTAICLPDNSESHCYNCLKRFIVGYPCENCASVRYCSSSCKEKSWYSFHRYECCYMNILTQEDVGLGHLALKLVVELGMEQLKKFETRMKTISLKPLPGLNENGIFHSEDYFCVYSLTGNNELRTSSDLFRRTLLAVFLSKILTKTGFIEDCEEINQTLVAAHLLKQIQMLPCNAHEVSELQMRGKEFVCAELKEIGSAVYTTLSLLNHSCDPSVVRHCYGDTCVLRSIKYIKKGDPIVDNYGFLYAVEDKLSRQQHLNDQYYFTCKCTPCEENWPLYNDLDESPPTFKCAECEGTLCAESKSCRDCKVIDEDVFAFEQIQKDFEECMKNVLDTGNIDENLPTLLNYLDTVSKKAVLPIIHLNNCQEIVKLCFSMQGNFAKL